VWFCVVLRVWMLSSMRRWGNVASSSACGGKLYLGVAGVYCVC